MAEVYFAVRTYTLSDAGFTQVMAPIACNFFFMHVVGTKLSFIISSDESNNAAIDTIEASWTEQVPIWSKPGTRWPSGGYMFSLKASSGNNGMQVGVTFAQ